MALTDDITDPRLAKALAHPLRIEILRHLGEGTASPSEIAAGIGAPLTNVSYHVRKLRALGLIRLVRKTPKRGVVEHYYEARPRRTLSDAGSGGGFNRSDAHLSRRVMRLDECGWQDVARVLAGAFEEVGKIAEAAAERVKGSHEGAIEAASVILLFEAPRKPVATAASTAGKPAARAGV